MADDKDKKDPKTPETAKEKPDETADKKTEDTGDTKEKRFEKTAEKKIIGKEPEKKETERSRIQNIEPQRLTFWQCWTVTKNAGLRLVLAFILPVALIWLGAYNWQKINWWLLTWPNVQTALLAVVGILAISWAIPWIFGTAIFGHIIVPYIGFILTGSYCYYTHRHPSVLVFNNKTYYKYNGAWYSLPDYYLELLRDNGKELIQIA